MSTSVANRLTGTELVNAGRQAKGHIDAAERHSGKAKEQYIAAGKYLEDAKRSLQHGQWIPWLEKYGIKERTARRCLQISHDPAVYDRERLTVREAETAVRAESRTYRANRPHVAVMGAMRSDPSELRTITARQSAADAKERLNETN